MHHIQNGSKQALAVMSLLLSNSLSQFCPSIWMLHSRRTNNKINRLQERALRIVYDDDVSTFDQLLAMGKSFCIHHQNIQRLLIENLQGSSWYFWEQFERIISESTISLRSKPELGMPFVNSILKSKNLHKILWFRNLELLTNRN